MKVFKVYVDRYDYDQYDSFVVVAESADDIRRNFYVQEYYDNMTFYPIRIGERRWNDIRFYDTQGEIHIEEVDLTKSAVICASYHAG